jgi:hypothetical protein
MILELTDLGDVGGHFHDLGNFTHLIPYGGGAGENIVLFAELGSNDLFRAVGLSVRECFHDRAAVTQGGSVFIDLKTMLTHLVAEMIPEFSVGGRDSEIFILNGNVAGDFFKQLT